jgi:hypothetical protein
MVGWVRAFRRTARKDKPIWGLHNYIDANRFRTSGTRALLRAAPYGKGLVHRDRRPGRAPQPVRIAFPGNRKHQAKATKRSSASPG